MEKKTAALAAIIVACILFAGCIGEGSEAPLKWAGLDDEAKLSISCGDVEPEHWDECCEVQNVDTPHIMCVGGWKWDAQEEACAYVCDIVDEAPIQGAEDDNVLVQNGTDGDIPSLPSGDGDVPAETPDDGIILGASCGTVSPDYRDECCERQNVDTPHIMCVGGWKWDMESQECAYVCDTEEASEQEGEEGIGLTQDDLDALGEGIEGLEPEDLGGLSE